MSKAEKVGRTKAAEVLSVIFHPLFIPLYGLLIIYSSPTLLSFIPSRLKMLIFVLVLTNNVLLPLSLAAIIWVRGTRTTFNPRGRNERVILLTFALMMYTLTAWLLLRMQVPNLFRAYFISIAVVTLIALLITTFYRISLHAVGIGVVLVLIIFMVVFYDINTVWQLTTVVIVGGAVLSARIWLGAHTPSEVWTGLLAGATVMALSLFFLIR